MAEALVDRFGKTPRFAGLYIPYEIDLADYQIVLHERLVGKYLRPAVGMVKLPASPGSFGGQRNLDRLPAGVVRMGIDILAPEDYGGRSTDASRALETVRLNAATLECVRKPLRDAGVALWVNC